MHNYEGLYGCFPPAYTTDENGKPMHSWRALLLPDLDPQMADLYDFDQPWDSPHNLAVAQTVPRIYRCPSSSDPDTTTNTCYAMIVGPETISDGPTTSTFQQISDGFSRTIQIVEVAASGIHWAEPRDLGATEISFAVNEGTGIGSEHPGGAFVVMCDTSVHFLDEAIDPTEIKAMSTIDGGEDVHLP